MGDKELREEIVKTFKKVLVLSQTRDMKGLSPKIDELIKKLVSKIKKVK